MSAPQFTPGPWQSMHDYTIEGVTTIIANVDGESFSDGTTAHTYDFICTCEDEFSERLSNAQANARLIAAAPKMYAALAAFEKQWNACGGNSHFGGLFQSVRDAAVDALAEADANHWLNAVKARGEQVPA